MLLITVIGRSGKLDTLYRYKVCGIGLIEDEDGHVTDVTINYKDGTKELIEDFVTLEVL